MHKRYSHAILLSLSLSPGMIHAGLGATHVNNFLTSMNIPPVQPKLLKRREREVGPQIESTAKRACREAVTEERKSGDSVTASYDMGWQKRGRAHNSLTGHGAFIGVSSKKVLGYQTRNKSCRQCHINNQQNSIAKDHDCRMNHHKSSKAMEPDVAVAIAKDLQKEGAKVTHVVGDDDASTIKHLRTEVDGSIEKISDVIHSKRSLASHLYELKKTNNEVTDGVIRYVLKCYAYAVNQNKEDADGIRRNLQAIIPHLYGDHSKCGQWCRYLEDPENYRHRSLPGGKDLKDPDTKNALERIMQMQIQNADNLAPVLNSQTNEAFNATVSTKAQKARHYGSSESNDFRVAAAVCQRNIGNSYVTEVCKEKNLSPGTFAMKHALFSDNVRANAIKRGQQKDTKIRRKELQQNRLRTNSTLEVREGTSYQKDCAFDLDKVDIVEIPAPLVEPKVSQIDKKHATEEAIILFDLETTGIGELQSRPNV